MSIQTMDESRQAALGEHIAAAERLEGSELEAISRLAGQLHGKPLMPVVGAGASYDCGVRVACEIGADLLVDYLANGNYAPHNTALTGDDLADIAEAIWVRTDQTQVVRDLGFPDAGLWRSAERMGEHFCVYCVLARLARERLLGESVSFNYDCGAEAGLTTEGFEYGDIKPGKQWPDHARVVADAATNAELVQDGAFKFYKAHGCAVRYRDVAETDEGKAAEDIVIRRAQLDNWRKFAWIRDPFRDRARHHVLLLVGFSGQDPKIFSELHDVLAEAYEAHPPDGTPRVVAIDLDPGQIPIESLIKAGLGEAGPHNGAVTKVCTDGSTTTAAMTVLLAEMLANELADDLDAGGVVLPGDLDARLATLIVSAPTMVRWSYLLRKPSDDEYIQRTNQMAQRGYVPLTERRNTTVRLIRARHELRRRLGHEGPETSDEALANHGFIVDRGIAYLPVGIDQEELASTCRQGHELERLRTTLQYPKIECVMVSGEGEDLRGVDLETGEGVEIDWRD